jgi:hypothetical protein
MVPVINKNIILFIMMVLQLVHVKH